jgi:hypothetical protein
MLSLLCLLIVLTVPVLNSFLYATSFDNKNGEIKNWTIYEELVNSCYSNNIADVRVQKKASFSGKYGMAIYANRNRTGFSNHVIAGHTVKPGTGFRSGSWSYKVKSFIPSSHYFTSQVGPELSIQNTRVIHDGTTTTTAIAGIQYVSNKWVTNKWNIWVPQQSNSNLASWVPITINNFTGFGPVGTTLKPDVWYELTLAVNYTSNKYLYFDVLELPVKGSSGKPTKPTNRKNKKYNYSKRVDLSNQHIALEYRGFAAGAVLTLEGENLYNNCHVDAPVASADCYQGIIYYDDVYVQHLDVAQ